MIIKSIRGLVLMSLFLLTFCDPPKKVVETSNLPSPELSPHTVVISQVDYLCESNEENIDAVIETLFTFSSESFQQRYSSAGLKKLLSSSDYSALLNCENYEVKEHFVDAWEAQYFVTISDNEGNTADFIFELSKKFHGGKCEKCWLTESIIPLKNQPKRKNSNPEDLQI